MELIQKLFASAEQMWFLCKMYHVAIMTLLSCTNVFFVDSYGFHLAFFNC